LAMLQSMTGYGRASGTWMNKSFTVEIRTLNSKMLDLTIKLPQEFRAKEIDYRKLVAEKLLRGKIDVSIFIENQDAKVGPEINMDLARAYFEQIHLLETAFDRVSPDAIGLILRMPEMTSNQKHEPCDEEFDFLFTLIDQATNQTVAFRAQEGEALAHEFKTNIELIAELQKSLEPYENERMLFVKERLQRNLEDKLGEYLDQNRLEQEFIMYIEKLDISEEKMRLTNHLSYFIETMLEGTDVGKKLGFISQEIGREVNTLGSKSNHAEMQKIVVQMKDLLEKIKEQILNTL